MLVKGSCPLMLKAATFATVVSTPGSSPLWIGEPTKPAVVVVVLLYAGQPPAAVVP